jgi:hypothetical protein
MRADFPALLTFKRTSDDTWRYNCHAWAADDDTRWWEPSPPGQRPPPGIRIFWPGGVDTAPSVSNYMAAFATKGFQPTATASHDIGVEKIALYANQAGIALHTARQLPSGRWTSKLGAEIDIEHETPDLLEGPKYGRVVTFMARSTRARRVVTVGTVFRWDPVANDFLPLP